MAGRGGFARYLALYAGLYGAYGCLSPLLPNLMAARGLAPEAIGLVLAAATLVRLVAAPLAGRLADARDAARPILAASAVAAGLLAAAHLPIHGLWPVLAAGLAYAVATAPLAPLADALALGAARGGTAFVYGRVRAAGSGAFIAAAVVAGWLAGAYGLAAAILMGGALFIVAGALAQRLPSPPAETGPRPDPVAVLGAGFGTLLRLAAFRRTLLVAALVIGAHGLHEAFAMILWRASGIGAGAAGLLWAEAVAAEVLVFLTIGPRLLGRIGLAGGLALAAAAGALRWGIAAQTVALPWLAGAQALHGLSFALLHLACLGLIGETVPAHLRATALTLYGSVGLGLAGALVTLASGPLYAAFGARAFWAMAALSLAALPLAHGLRAR